LDGPQTDPAELAERIAQQQQPAAAPPPEQQRVAQ
jgi:hypothetical protein